MHKKIWNELNFIFDFLAPSNLKAIAAQVDYLHIANVSPLDFNLYEKVLENVPSKQLMIDLPDYSSSRNNFSSNLDYENLSIPYSLSGSQIDSKTIPEICFSSRHFLSYEKIGKFVKEKHLAGVVLHDLLADYPHFKCQWKYPQLSYIESVLNSPCHFGLA